MKSLPSGIALGVVATVLMAVAAFVSQLPGLSADDYAALTGEAGSGASDAPGNPQATDGDEAKPPAANAD